jgi:hypothetical protein
MCDPASQAYQTDAVQYRLCPETFSAFGIHGNYFTTACCRATRVGPLRLLIPPGLTDARVHHH